MFPFSIGFSELILIAIAILVIVGPEGFPQVAKMLMRTVRSLRLMANELREQLNLDELKRELFEPVEELKRDQDFRDFSQLNSELKELQTGLYREANDLPDAQGSALADRASEQARKLKLEAPPLLMIQLLALSQSSRPRCLRRHLRSRRLLSLAHTSEARQSRMSRLSSTRRRMRAQSRP